MRALTMIKTRERWRSARRTLKRTPRTREQDGVIRITVVDGTMKITTMMDGVINKTTTPEGMTAGPAGEIETTTGATGVTTTDGRNRTT
jgi:hypothetical protein